MFGLPGLQLEAAAHPGDWLKAGRFLSVCLMTGEKVTQESQKAHLSQKWALIGCDLTWIRLCEARLLSTFDLYLAIGEAIPIPSPTGC